MKNKFIITIFLILLNLNSAQIVLAEEFIFEISNLEITDNGNTYKGKNRGKIMSNTEVELVSNNFEYLKKKNQLKVEGNVQVFDFKNNISINAETIFYFKNKNKISSIGKTLIQISNDYTIEGYDLTLLMDEMVLSSKKNTTIKDKNLNEYTLEKFQYFINQEILKGENIHATINQNNQTNDDKLLIKTGFFDLKKNKFLAKDIVANLNKDLFGNNKNDPRINAVSATGDEFITTF